jgi:hypothetical protein
MDGLVGVQWVTTQGLGAAAAKECTPSAAATGFGGDAAADDDVPAGAAAHSAAFPGAAPGLGAAAVVCVTASAAVNSAWVAGAPL